MKLMLTGVYRDNLNSRIEHDEFPVRKIMLAPVPLTPAFDTGKAAVYLGDCIDVLSRLDAQSVQTCVTSPPYWGLRDYGTATWEGGDAECDHTQRSLTSTASTLGEWKNGGGQRHLENAGGVPFRDVCGKCGAVRVDRQIGLEPTPEEYVAKIVAVFRAVSRVLCNDGTLWLNIGDSYNSSDKWGGGHTNTGKHTVAADGTVPSFAVRRRKLVRTGSDCDPKRGKAAIGQPLKHCAGLKPKDLVGIPWMVAFALRADGWWLRQDIVWSKPNAMPESVKDRCCKSHEYIFLLSKSAKYHYDADAIAEPAIAKTNRGGNIKMADSGEGVVLGRATNPNGGLGTNWEPEETRNKRSVWTVASHALKAAHFATFPPKLIEPCILAGCPEGGTVLDPFNGSGTTGLVANNLGRKYVGIELNPEYIELTRKRLQQKVLF